MDSAQTPCPLYPGIGCIHRLCGASSHADLEGSAASPVCRQRERVVLLAIGPATKMSAKSFAGNSGPRPFGSIRPLGLLGLSKRDVARPAAGGET